MSQPWLFARECAAIRTGPVTKAKGRLLLSSNHHHGFQHSRVRGLVKPLVVSHEDLVATRDLHRVAGYGSLLPVFGLLVQSGGFSQRNSLRLRSGDGGTGERRVRVAFQPRA